MELMKHKRKVFYSFVLIGILVGAFTFTSVFRNPPGSDIKTAIPTTTITPRPDLSQTANLEKPATSQVAPTQSPVKITVSNGTTVTTKTRTGTQTVVVKTDRVKVIVTPTTTPSARTLSKPLLNGSCKSQEVGRVLKWTSSMSKERKLVSGNVTLMCFKLNNKYVWAINGKGKWVALAPPEFTPTATKTSATPAIIPGTFPSPWISNWHGYVAPTGLVTFTSCIRTKNTDNQQVTSAPGTTLTGPQYLWSITGKVTFSGGHYRDGYGREITPDMKIVENFNQNVTSISPDYPGYSGEGELFGAMLPVLPFNIKDGSIYGGMTDADMKYISVGQSLPDGFCKYE